MLLNIKILLPEIREKINLVTSPVKPIENGMGIIVESTTNRRKRQEILQEILKSVDKTKVEIIDKRRKTLK